MPSVKRSAGRTVPFIAGGFAEAPADERCQEQLAWLVSDLGEDGQRRPSTNALDSEQRDRPHDRSDLVAQTEVGGIDVAEQSVAERDIG